MLETASGAAGWLDADTHQRLTSRVDEALRRARSTGVPTALSVTAAAPRALDPMAVVAASRVAGEPWFSFEQPDRDGWALATLGCAASLEASGPARFDAITAATRDFVRHALIDPYDGPAGSGLVFAGGFAFAPDERHAGPWAGFGPASLDVPELSLARHRGDSWITVNQLAAPDDTPADVMARIERRLDSLSERPPPLLDPSPAGAYEVTSPIPPSHYEEAVRRAVEKIAGGEFEKIVLAREVIVRAPHEHDPAAVLGILREAFPSCYVFAVGRGDATFLGASPELLIRREGQRASTVALAGSTRRSADPAIDDLLGEQLRQSAKDREENAIVARRIARALAPHSVWVTPAPEPSLIRVANIQHLGAPIRAQLAKPLGAIALAGLLHPTPAVGGEPAEIAEPLIPALEGLDRGWYAGPIGWSDGGGDGEFCVALRCALLRAREAHLYAGGGIVRDSDPAAELAETEVKLQALLPVLAA